MIGEAVGQAVGAALTKYGAIIGGLLIGTAAKYGLALNEGKRLTWKGALADLLLLGILGFVAVVFSDGLHLEGNAKVLAGAIAAVCSDRLVKLIRDRALKSAEGQMARLLPSGDREAIMRVPAGLGDPCHMDIQVPTKSSTGAERLQSNLRQSYGHTGDRPVPEDQIEALRRIDGD